PFVIVRSQLMAITGIALVRPDDARLPGRLRALRQRATIGGEPRLVAFEAVAMGVVAAMQGRWAEAAASHVRAETELARTSEAFAELNASRTFRTMSLFYLGDIRVLAARMPQLAAEARARGDLLALLGAVSTVGVVAWLAKDDVETVAREADE